LPENYLAGSRRIPSAAKPLSAANDVGRSPLLEQDTHARKRLFLDWQGADDTATRHDFYRTTPGKVQPPEHPLTFTSLCRQHLDQASRLRLQHSPPQSQGHARERTSCADQPPLPAQPFSPACTTPGEPAFGSALRQRAGAGGDCQARHHDRNVHRPKVTCAGDISRQATPIHQPQHLPFFKVHSICAQRLVLAAAAGQARLLRLPKPLQARGAYPEAAKPLSAANGVGRSPLLEQDTHARKRLFLDWQGADDTATRHDFYRTTPGKVQPPEHPLTFTSLCRQHLDQASRLRLQHSPPQSQGHARERTSCADQPPLPAQPFSPACTTPGEPAFGSALRQRAGAGGDCQARHHDRNVHRPKVTCAGDISRQATPIHQPQHLPFFKVHSICAQR
jgi:hypothetical protein